MTNHPPMPLPVKKGAVLGSGTMGAQIAAHLANAGISSYLLDIVPEESQKSSHPGKRNRLALEALERLKKMKPSPFFAPELARLIVPGNFEDDLPKLQEADWIIEAVLERLEIKQALLFKVEQHRSPDSIVSSNTSGIKISEISKTLSPELRSHFLGTHFFNPPRTMKLVEIIPTPDTLPAVTETIAFVAQELLGKGIVYSKDTPNFIANRIGAFSVLFALHDMVLKGYTVEEIDALTGPVIGRPKSATLRTLDLVGLDLFGHVAENLYRSLPDDEMRDIFSLPEFVRKMIGEKWLGEKTSQGFYKKKNGEIQALDLLTFHYRLKESARLASVELAKETPLLKDRLKILAGSKDKGGEFFRRTFAALLAYASRRIPEISDSLLEIDKAMRWGFGWETGPFQLWDMLGVAEFIPRIEKEGFQAAPWVLKMISSGKKNFYEKETGIRSFYDFRTTSYQPVPLDKKTVDLALMKENQENVVCENSGASLIHLGSGILCLEFHTKMNTIGEEILKMANQALDQLEENYEALILGNQGEHFSLGANLMLILMLAEEEEWDEISRAVLLFQGLNQKIKYARKPVVAAPRGRTLGGGCEMVLHARHAVAQAESYLGLVEMSAGLIPAGGGVKEMLCRPLHPSAVFQTIATAAVSTSAHEAKKMAYLRETDPVVMNADYHLYEAKKYALEFIRQGYRPPPKAPIKISGKPLYENLVNALEPMRESKAISDYDAYLGKKLAHVISGGEEPFPKEVDESHILNLEREVFLSLCGEKKTKERMRHLLKTGKPLRN